MVGLKNTWSESNRCLSDLCVEDEAESVLDEGEEERLVEALISLNSIAAGRTVEISLLRN